MRKLLLLALGGVIALLSACAHKTVATVPTVTTPKYPDFMRPAVPGALQTTGAAANFDRGWQFLQFGDLKNAEHEFSLSLQATPAFYPAETALGYVEFARKDYKSALPHFDRALERESHDVSSLVGRGNTLLALDRRPEALAAYDLALAADPSLTDLKRRVEVMRFQVIERSLADARDAARGGRLDQAIAAYQGAIATSPESAFLYRELAAVERQKGDADPALEHFRKAASLEPGDAGTRVQIAELLEAKGDVEAALNSYSEALAISPDQAIEARVETLKAKIALARLPEQYRAIDTSPQLTRADLAALIGVRLAPVLQMMRSRDGVLITDIRNNWAETWIMSVARAGVMEPFANHTFQPRTVVRRSDLAQALSHILPAIAPATELKQWQAARVKFSDLAASHLAYASASLAVAAGVMSSDGGFQASRAVSGQEAIQAIERLQQMAHLPIRNADNTR
jgi:tetratricopeptide (TPR) repeat protein